jgi:hypothetical protein
MSEYLIWSFIEGDNTCLTVAASSTIFITQLKDLIIEKRGDRLRVSATSTLWKVHYF